MLSGLSRTLTHVTAGLYFILGAALFFLPAQMAPVFAWKVTRFMTMTIGGWCLGNAWLAFFTARRWEWRLVYPAMVYLWSFGILEASIVILFRDKLQLADPIAWVYLLTLVINVLAALLGFADWLRIRPSNPVSDKMTGFMRFLAIAFVVFVGFLGAYGLTARIGDLGTNREIFPEVMSLFTLRSFGAFYFSLAIGMIPLLFERSRTPFLGYGFLTLGLIIIITVAAFAHLSLFDFAEHPFGTVYFAAYMVAGLIAAFLFWRYGTGSARSH